MENRMTVVGTNAPEMTSQPSQTQSQPVNNQQQQPAVTPATDVKPEKPKDPNGFGRQFSALSKREKAIREQEKQFKAREAEIAKLQEQYSPEALKRKLKLNPIETLKELGVDYDYVTNVALDGKVPEQTKREVELEERLAKLEARLQKYEPKEENSEVDEKNLSPEELAQKYEQEYIDGIEPFIQGNNEKYALVNKYGQDAIELVYAFANQIHEEKHKQGMTGYIPSYDEAADLAEAYLEEQVKDFASVVEKRKKPSESQGKDSSKPQSNGSQSSPTLSNQHSTTRPSEGDPLRLSEEERIKRAAALIRHL
jgi:hypothetical protein